jgi:hypothetical protein
LGIAQQAAILAALKVTSALSPSLTSAVVDRREAPAADGARHAPPPRNMRLAAALVIRMTLSSATGTSSNRCGRPLVSEAGVPYRKYHTTRLGRPTQQWLSEDVADLRWVQAQMGHASIVVAAW